MCHGINERVRQAKIKIRMSLCHHGMAGMAGILSEYYYILKATSVLI